jgi:TolB protein
MLFKKPSEGIMTRSGGSWCRLLGRWAILTIVSLLILPGQACVHAADGVLPTKAVQEKTAGTSTNGTWGNSQLAFAPVWKEENKDDPEKKYVELKVKYTAVVGAAEEKSTQEKQEKSTAETSKADKAKVELWRIKTDYSVNVGIATKVQEKVKVEDPARPCSAVSLVGPWQVKSLWITDSDWENGNQPSPYSIVITEKTLTLRTGDKVVSEMSYTADSKQTPCTIDAKSADGPMLGIYELKGNSLKISLNDEAKGRPASFDKKPGGMVLVLGRCPVTAVFVMNADGTDLHRVSPLSDVTATGSPEWSHDGTWIAYDGWRSVVGENNDDAHVFTVNADGSSPKDLGPGAMPSWSPDGKRLTYSEYAPERGVWIMNADGSDRQLIDDAGWGSEWSPKRNEIAYTTHDGPANICVYDVEKKQRRKLLEKDYRAIRWGMSWSSDGAWIAFHGHPTGAPDEIGVVSVEGEKKGFRRSTLSEIGSAPPTVACGEAGNQVLASLQMPGDRVRHLYIVDPVGAKPPQVFPGFPADWTSCDMAWSADGKRVAFSAQPQTVQAAK